MIITFIMVGVILTLLFISVSLDSDIDDAYGSYRMNSQFDRADVAEILKDISIVLFFLTIGFACIAPVIYSTKGEIVYEEIDYEPAIYSLESDVGVEGHFVLGSGNIDSKQYYFYYVKSTDIENRAGAAMYQAKKLKADECRIILTDEIEPCITLYRPVRMKEKNYWVSWGDEVYNASDKAYYRIYVPEDALPPQEYSGMIGD